MTAARLKDVADIRVSNVDKKIIEGETQVRLCNYTDVYYNPRVTGDLPFMVSTASREQVQRFGLRRGDVVITKDSETADDIAVPARIETDASDLVCGYHLAIIRPNSADLDARYLYWTMASSPTREFYTTAATGVTRFGLRQDSIGDLRVRIPAGPEQRAIAEFLDAETARIDALIGAAKSLMVALREKYSASLHGAVTGAELTGSRASSGLPWAPELPDAWGVAPLKYVAKLGSGHTPSRSVPEYWVDCSIPWISLFDVGRMRDPFQITLDATAQQISELGMANSSATLHPAGTVVLSRTASVGFSTVMSTPMAVSQHFATWTCGPDILPRYLLYLLRAMRQHWEALEVGTTNVTVFMPDLGAIHVPLPPITTQQQAVDVVDRAIQLHQRLTTQLTRQHDVMRERRQALITAAVTGEIDVSTASGRGVRA